MAFQCSHSQDIISLSFRHWVSTEHKDCLHSLTCDSSDSGTQVCIRYSHIVLFVSDLREGKACFPECERLPRDL
jgi:hypothetical protein